MSSLKLKYFLVKNNIKYKKEKNENYVFRIKDEIYDLNPEHNEEVREFFNKNKEEIIRNYVLNKIEQDDFYMSPIMGEEYGWYYRNNKEDIFSYLDDAAGRDFEFIFGNDGLRFYISDKGAITANSYEKEYYNDGNSHRVLIKKQNIEIPGLKDLQNTLVKKEISNYIEKEKTFIVKKISNKFFSNSRDTISLEQELEKQLVKHFNRTYDLEGQEYIRNFMITSVKDNNIILENGDKIDVSDIIQEISQQINDYINDFSQEMKEKYPNLSNNKSRSTDRQGDKIKEVAKQNTYWIDTRLH